MSKDNITVKGFVKEFRTLPPSGKKILKPLLENMKVDLIAPNDELTGTKVRGFRLEGQEFEAVSHIDVLRKVIRYVLMKRPLEKEKLLLLHGRKNKYFSKDPGDLRLPELIRGTNIYFETNENAQSICVRCERILKLYDIDYTSFEIEIYN